MDAPQETEIAFGGDSFLTTIEALSLARAWARSQKPRRRSSDCAAPTGIPLFFMLTFTGRAAALRKRKI